MDVCLEEWVGGSALRVLVCFLGSVHECEDVSYDDSYVFGGGVALTLSIIVLILCWWFPIIEFVLCGECGFVSCYLVLYDFVFSCVFVFGGGGVFLSWWWLGCFLFRVCWLVRCFLMFLVVCFLLWFFLVVCLCWVVAFRCRGCVFSWFLACFFCVLSCDCVFSFWLCLLCFVC